jgi:hypothetical protein
MPNNCSALIQRKQNSIHKVLRSSSEGKLQNGEKKKFFYSTKFLSYIIKNVFAETIY